MRDSRVEQGTHLRAALHNELSVGAFNIVSQGVEYELV